MYCYSVLHIQYKYHPIFMVYLHFYKRLMKSSAVGMNYILFSMFLIVKETLKNNCDWFPNSTIQQKIDSYQGLFNYQRKIQADILSISNQEHKAVNKENLGPSV